MTLITSAITKLGDVANNLTVQAMLKTGTISEKLKDACFDGGILTKTLDAVDRHPLKPVIIKRGNIPERVHGVFQENVNLPDIAHKVAKSIENNLAPQNIVIDNAIQAIDQWSHPIAQVLGTVQNFF